MLRMYPLAQNQPRGLQRRGHGSPVPPSIASGGYPLQHLPTAGATPASAARVAVQAATNSFVPRRPGITLQLSPPPMSYRPVAAQAPARTARGPPPGTPRVARREPRSGSRPVQPLHATPTVEYRSPRMEFRRLEHQPNSRTVHATPTIEHRSPLMEHRTIMHNSPKAIPTSPLQTSTRTVHTSPKIVPVSPVVQYRAHKGQITSSPMQMTRAGKTQIPSSPVQMTRPRPMTAQYHRQVGGPLNGVRRECRSPGTQVRTLVSPMSPVVTTTRSPRPEVRHGHVLYTPSQSTRSPHEKVSANRDPILNDIPLNIPQPSHQFLSTVANGPASKPSPEPPLNLHNSLAKFLEGVAAGEIVPPMCKIETDIDPQRYHMKRSTQNQLRRLLEHLQECLYGGDIAPGAELGNLAFDKLARQPGGLQLLSLSEQAFISGLSQIGQQNSHDCDFLGRGDRQEVFAALLAPSSAAVKGLNLGQPVPTELTRRLLCEGLTRVPFNLPDFPVQMHCFRALNTPSKVEVADLVASIFSAESTGIDQVKDWYLTGLLSLEEIQASLPMIYPHSLVDEAAMRIVRIGLRYFTEREWSTLVICVRPEAVPLMQAASEAEAQTHAASYSTLDADLTMPLESEGENTHAPDRDLGSPARGSTDGGVSTPPTAPPVSERLLASPATDLESTPQSLLNVASSGRENGHLCDWSINTWRTPPSGGGLSGETTTGSRSHQADQGAGGPSGRRGANGCRVSEVDRSQGSELHPMGTEKRTLCHDDLAVWVSLELHNECRGPFLARAFVRCCQLYQDYSPLDVGS
eukprot:gnl/TRDRNA2_/TRDRNA2_88076_c0_seq1.p1 gnl/TRDRNA2_/TRDRNA2_88076_c0~~gnl/TRDRNA2_/TRDRNA2_88076_c0_seq1.p1  ORF type:complete len:802 (+),score=98.24 gnl/TRDRNA2_/TRDRNA2_88076_c0_seq1:42-2447(+)